MDRNLFRRVLLCDTGFEFSDFGSAYPTVAHALQMGVHTLHDPVGVVTRRDAAAMPAAIVFPDLYVQNVIHVIHLKNCTHALANSVPVNEQEPSSVHSVACMAVVPVVASHRRKVTAI